MSLRKEIFEQPDILENLLKNQWSHVSAIASELKKHNPDYIYLAARGTSDNAGRYAKYLLGIENGLPTALAAPSIFSIYGKEPRLANAAVLAISQSGQSPDIVNVVAAGSRQNIPTLAVTNEAESPLAQAADFVIDIQAGEEKAVAATKTYTAQLMTIAMLSTALSDNQEKLEALHKIPAYFKKVLELESLIEEAVSRYYYMEQCVVLGRGYNYATAFEWALKMKELTYVSAEPYSSADFLHGPIAVVEQGFPVMAAVSKGAVYAEMYAVLEKLKSEHQANLLVISNHPDALEKADVPIPLPDDLPEWLSPLVSIVPAQLFCYWLTKLKGYNPEAPRGLSKVTKTN